LSTLFPEIYSPLGRGSIPPERRLRALLLQVLYSIRREQMLMEQLNYNLLFFYGLSISQRTYTVASVCGLEELQEEESEEEAPGMIPAIRRWTFVARSAAMRRMRPPPIRRPNWRRKARGKKPS
jgi:hypothetical protein